jgi:CHAD domain-containing protein
MARSLKAAGAETVMPPSRTSAAKANPRARARRHDAAPRLNARMACDTAFRVIARRYLGDLTANQAATCQGDPTALHQMRIALTRLRTAILFFSPMIADSQRSQVRDQLKWLNAHLGAVRDLDVAIERIDTTSPLYRSWHKKRADSHRLLARALQSVRYRRLVEDTSGWIENGPWSIKRGKQATGERGSPIAAYGADRLAQWQQKLLKKSRKLMEMDPQKRHRLRLLNKKLSYSIEALKELFSDKRFSGLKISLKHLRKAQRCLGQLNDDAKGHSLAAALQRGGADAHLQFLSPKREKQLLRTAAAAYRKLATLT